MVTVVPGKTGSITQGPSVAEDAEGLFISQSKDDLTYFF